MKKETLISVLFGAIGMIAWYFPSIELSSKISITVIVTACIFLIYFKDRFAYFFRKYWQEIISVGFVATSVIVFKEAFPGLLIPMTIVMMTSISISLLIGLKYRQKLVYKGKILINAVSVTLPSWRLNHWGSKCATVSGQKMIFTGTMTPLSTDGSHIDLLNALNIGSVYEVRCFAKSELHTTGRFQLWCHDKPDPSLPSGVVEATPYKTPSVRGEEFKVNFKADFNPHIRIHLQYEPGIGLIEVTDVALYKLIT